MRINLGNTPLFRGMTVPDIEEMLRCLRAAERTYKKGAVILPEGTPTEQLGVVLSGRVIIEMGGRMGQQQRPQQRGRRRHLCGGVCLRAG